MSYKPEESTLMAFLYGELSEEEKRKVEAYLSENKSAREEFEQLKEAQFILNKVKDREVEVPTFVFDNASKVVVSARSQINGFWKRSLAIAASIAILIVAGYLTKADFKIGSEGVQLSFGKQTENLLSQEQVQAMIASALSESNKVAKMKFEGVENKINTLASYDEPSLDEKKIAKYLAEIRQQNLEVISSLLEASELSQRKYTNELIQDFAIFLDIQRQNDLNVIQTRFENLADDTELNQLQTNQILTSLLSSSGEPTNQY